MDIPVVNGTPVYGNKSTNISGWVVDYGTPVTRWGYFMATAPESLMHQDIDISELASEYIDKVSDPSAFSFSLKWEQASYVGSDKASMYLDQLDGAGNILQSGASLEDMKTVPGGGDPKYVPGGAGWYPQEFVIACKAGVKIIRLYYHNVRVAGADSNGEVSGITCALINTPEK